ncbi:MAG: glycosyltransferase family 1 protein [Ignavibacteriaceae bacterium]
MRIGFYIHHSMLKAGGIFTYSIGILKLLLNQTEIETLVIVTTPEVKLALESFVDSTKIEFQLLNRESTLNKARLFLSYFSYDTYIIYRHYFPKSKILFWLKDFSNFLNPFRRLIERSKIELLHVPIQYSPIYKTIVPVITTMHDVQEFHFPEFFSASERLHRAINNLKSVSESDHIIVSFSHIKNDLIKFYSVADKKISVCPPPFADDWFSTKKETDWKVLQTKYSISKKYLLYPAATWPHKNHINLITALDKIKKLEIELNLICTGNKTDFYSKIENYIKDYRLTDSIKFLGIVPEEDLIGLYKNSELVVIPTLYEAGSGPLYEAMRYNVPVICANTTSLPETIGAENFIFNPKDVDELSNLILKMLEDDILRNENIKNSEKRMRELGEKNYFESFNNVYKTFTSNTNKF